MIEKQWQRFFLLSKILVTVYNGTFQEAEEDSEDASDLDEELFNDPDTQEIIRNLVLQISKIQNIKHKPSPLSKCSLV